MMFNSRVYNVYYILNRKCCDFDMIMYCCGSGNV